MAETPYVDKITDKDNNEAAIKHSYLNPSGNLEISSKNIPNAAADAKLNLVSGDSIQIKPGDNANIQFDCEQNSGEQDKGNPSEFEMRIVNGSFDKSVRTVGTKLNVAEITIDNQKAHTTQTDNEETFDIDKIKINFRTDKWKTGTSPNDKPVRSNHKGPVDVKFRAKSFDIRCHGTNPGGGIALQPCGTDNNGNENKIKFESSRKSTLDASGAIYDTEGGQGLEFGTFNNLHTSLFTKDYRFNQFGKVYAVTRGVPSLDPTSGKFDYPTQSDDFKDITGEVNATWDSIVKAAMVFDKFILEPDRSAETLIGIIEDVFLQSNS